MDKVTQGNAANAEESAAAAEELNAQSQQLMKAVQDLQQIVGGQHRQNTPGKGKSSPGRALMQGKPGMAANPARPALKPATEPAMEPIRHPLPPQPPSVGAKSPSKAASRISDRRVRFADHWKENLVRIQPPFESSATVCITIKMGMVRMKAGKGGSRAGFGMDCGP
jgi:methyl-accepting chemotaxis protein